VLAWRLSIALGETVCVEALKGASGALTLLCLPLLCVGG